ncbi:MAG TPA: tetratricopeptide repeat protein, partial [Thermoanaerobaculia bacterium]
LWRRHVSKRIPTPEGAVLRLFRDRKGLTRPALARRAGVSVPTVHRWETGAIPLARERLVEVLAPWDVPPEAIDAVLFGDSLASPPGEPGQPTERPSPEPSLITRASAAVGWAAAKAIGAELKVDHLRRQAPWHRQWAEERWSRMKKLEARQQDKIVDALLGDERSWALAERISAASVTAAAHRAEESLRLVRLAVRIAGQVPGPERWRLRFLGWVEPFLGNALRVGGDLTAAGKAFARAEDLWKRGEGGDPAGLLDGMRRLDLKASLLRQQGQFAEALDLLDQALEGSPPEAAARLLIMKATTHSRAGNYELAIEVLRQAEPRIDPQREPRLPWVLQLNLAVNYCHLDRYRDAEPLVPMVEALAEDLRNELDRVRSRWLRGRTWAGLRRREEAVAALSQVRQYLFSKEIAYDYALASTELATLHLEQGRTRLVQELAKEMRWIFKAQGVHKEALAALALFCQAAKAEKAEAEWTRRLVKYLYRAQHNPNLRFEP